MLIEIKRKAERTSKNHIKAKSDWREKLEKLENGELLAKDLNVKPNTSRLPGSDLRQISSLS